MYVYVHTDMATKTITITKEAYDRLQSRKEHDESFSDVILRLTERRPLTDFVGMLEPNSVDAIRRAIVRTRREQKVVDARQSS